MGYRQSVVVLTRYCQTVFQKENEMKVYRFTLIDEEGGEFMGTELDEPNPQIDAEFWDRFMQGNCTMQYRGEVEESDDGN